MTSALPTQRVAVIGAGILGVSTAVHLLRGGVDVELITEGEPASGASGRSLSWLNSAGARSAPYHRLRQAGIDRYRTLFAADPTREWLQFGGGLFWDAPDRVSSTRSRHAYEKSIAYDSALLRPEEIAGVTGGVDESAASQESIFNPGEGWVSLPHLIEHLLQEFDNLGGKLERNAGTASVEVIDGRTVGVRLGDGRVVSADSVVVACGAATPDVVAEHGVHIDNASPTAMLVVTEPVEHGLTAVLNSPRVAARPNPGGTLGLDHDWYEESIVHNADGSYSIDEEVVQTLVNEASKIIAGNPKMKPASWKIGPKPIPGDGEPVFGQLEKVPGCFVAFSHSGATLGLIAGELLADEILTGGKHPMLQTFRPERFAQISEPVLEDDDLLGVQV